MLPGTNIADADKGNSKTAALASDLDLASQLIRAMHEVIFPCVDSRYWRYVSNQSSFTPQVYCYLGKGQAFSVK